MTYAISERRSERCVHCVQKRVQNPYFERTCVRLSLTGFYGFPALFGYVPFTEAFADIFALFERRETALDGGLCFTDREAPLALAAFLVFGHCL